MLKNFFKNKFYAINGTKSLDWRNELINHMVIYFTTYVLSTIHHDDYVIPNYVRKLLYNFDYELIIPGNEIEYVLVDFKDFKVVFEENSSVDEKAEELRQKILMYSRINYVVFNFYEIDDESDVFRLKDIDVLILDRGLGGYNVFVRDKYCPYLIHKYSSFDDDIYIAIDDSNRSIMEFFAKVEAEYILSFFL